MAAKKQTGTLLRTPFMTSDTVVGRKRLMSNRVEQVLLQPTMGIMTGYTGVRTGGDTLMGGSKTRRSLVVTARTQLTNTGHGHRLEIGTMGSVANGTILCGRLVHGPITPVLRHFTMTTKTQGRLTTV
jgi:hypothetical protein